MTKQPVKCPKCQQRFECEPASDPFIHCPTCGAKLRAPRPGDALLGATLGEFEILELLGRGGMGAVYKGRQTSLDRLVAVKILPRAFSSDARYVERFRREARSAAAVRHPNIIEIHAIGEAEGYPFIAMEFIDGETLRARLEREGRLEPQRAMDFLKQTASALERAHEAGILHRDIKPSNILIDAHGLVKVADFGLAKREHGDVSVTQTGHVLGTALYMPPETARGEAFDARSDLYSLGATFYHALAGRAPFEAGTTAELVLKHVEAAPAALQQAAPEAPPALCRIVHRLLRKNPRERYASARELLEALDRAEARPAPATTRAAGERRRAAGTRPPRGAAWKRRLPRIAAGAAALAVLAVILVVALRARTGRPKAAPPVPQPRRQHAAAKTPPPPKPDPREQSARDLFASIQRTARDGTWLSAQSYLDRLDRTCADTKFYAANRAAIGAVRGSIQAALSKPAPPKPASGTKPAAKAPAPQPQTQKPTVDAGASKRRAAAAYAGESAKVWALLKERKYGEAGDLVGRLAARSDLELASERLEADRTAVALLAEFWQAVEKGLAKLKGKTLVLGGIGGTLESVEGGVLTIRTPAGATKRGNVGDLATAQAVSYSGLGDARDAHSKLVLGVFLLAEGADPGNVEKALAKAGRSPEAGVYRERAAAAAKAATAAQEDAAREAWGKIERAAKAKLDRGAARRLADSLSDFQKAHRNTRFHATLAKAIRTLKARVARGLEPAVYTQWPFDATEARRRQFATASDLAAKVEQQFDLGRGVKLKMVLIPAGEFLMGRGDKLTPTEIVKLYGGEAGWFLCERPQHRVRISRPFWLGEHEVTQQQWLIVMGSNPSRFKAPRNPVEQVSWEDCQTFIARLNSKVAAKGFRLPTEAEWEHACRAGTSTEFYSGNGTVALNDYAWWKGNSPDRTCPVGCKRPNAWRLHDMHGNVWEWCQDGYSGYPKSLQTDPTGYAGATYRVLRGGASQYGAYCSRSAYRRHRTPDFRHHNYGFRVARSAP